MEQGRPAELEKPIKRNWFKIVFEVITDVILAIAIFYAGYIFGNSVFGGDCPPLEVVKNCYACTNKGIMTMDMFRNLTVGVLG